MDTKQSKLALALRSENYAEIENLLKSGADPNTFLYGYFLENQTDYNIIILLINYGAEVKHEYFTESSNVLYIGSVLKISDRDFWVNSLKRFFPEDFYPKIPITDDLPEDVESIQTTFKNHAFRVFNINFEYFNFGVLKNIYKKNYKFRLDDPYYDSLIKWDLCKESPFSLIAINLSINKICRKYIRDIKILLLSIKISKEDNENNQVLKSLRKSSLATTKIFKENMEYTKYEQIKTYNLIFQKYSDIIEALGVLHERVI